MNQYLSLVYILVFVGFRPINAQCRSGWMHHNSQCYFFSNDHFDWVEAEELCKLFVAKLAEPRTMAESHFIIGHAEQLNDIFWLGISDIISEDEWIYTSDSNPISVKNWGPGDPNGYAGSNCVCTYNLANYHSLWADEPCSRKYKAVCERPVEEQTLIG